MRNDNASDGVHEESPHGSSEAPVDARLPVRETEREVAPSSDHGSERLGERSPLAKEKITFTVERAAVGWEVRPSFSRFVVGYARNLGEVGEIMLQLWEYHVAD